MFDIGCPRSHKDANPGLSDTNTQVPLINPQNCSLSSSLPAFTSPLVPPLGQGLGLGPSASVLQGVDRPEQMHNVAPR